MVLPVGFALLSSGCWGGDAANEPSDPPFQGVTLRVTAIGDPAVLQTVRAQGGEWSSELGADLVFSDARTDPASVDVLIYPGERLGDLVDESVLAVLPESVVRRDSGLMIGSVASSNQGERSGSGSEIDPGSIADRRDPLAFGDVVPGFRTRVTRYGEDRFGLPIGGSALVLVYRRDAFTNEANLQAAESEGLSLEPPATWEDLDALARFFQDRDWDGDGQPESGIALALGPDPESVGTATFLARAAALGQIPDRYDFLFDSDSMAPRIATEPFVEALDKLVALKKSGPPGVEGFDIEAARAAFRAGEVAFLIDRAERALRWSDPTAPVPASVAPLPGSDRIYDVSRNAWIELNDPNRPSYLPLGGGWLVGITAGTSGRTLEAATSYIQALAGPDLANAIALDPAFLMVPVRARALEDGLPSYMAPPGLDPRSWGDAASRTYSASKFVLGPRIPESEAYLADLEAARVAAVAGTTASEALAKAARSWSVRVDRLGLDRQLWHYRRSLNGIPTDPNPPPNPIAGAARIGGPSPSPSPSPSPRDRDP